MEPFLGQIQLFGFNFAPRGWAKCEGQLLSIAQYSALFALLGTMYGGDGRTTFALPDLRGRAAVGYGTGPGLSSIQIGQKGGTESITISQGNLPNHNHSLNLTIPVNTGNGDENNAQNNVIATHDNAFSEDASAGANLAPVAGTTNSTGGSQAFNVRDPFLGLNYCIALTGIYPSRN